jgi:glycosyltransferase involved in cell wall biosynthesis
MRIAMEHCNRLQDRGHEVTIIDKGNNTHCSWFPCRVPIVPILNHTEKYDVMVSGACECYMWVKEQGKAKRKWYFMQMIEQWFNPTDRRWYGMCEAVYQDRTIPIWTICPWGAEFLEKKHGHKDVPVIGNGLDPKDWYHDTTPFPGKQGAPKLVILTEGHQNNRCKDEEGFTWEVAMTMKENHPNIAIWGYSASVHKYQKSFDKWLLHPTTQQMRQMYSQAYMLIKGSRYDFRAGAPVEAMACGTPTVRGLIKEDIDMIDEQTCLRVGYDGHAMLAKAERLYRDQVLHQRLVSNGLLYVEEHLAWDDKIIAIEKLLRG